MTSKILLKNVIAPHFYDVHKDIKNHSHTEYVEKGGRGGAKSSFFAVEVILLIKKNPLMHALITRQVKDTLADSVYAQILWAIDALSLNKEFYCKKSPLEIIYKQTGQKIYFRGADDPYKIKSIKPPFGYIGILWFEELDQFKGDNAVRNIEQSAMRGGDKAYIFKSYNPPKTSTNWVNKYVLIPKDSRLVHHTTYKGVPDKWLGLTFIEEAEYLRQVNPKAYEHEYEGIPNATGGNVFDNVVVREIKQEEVEGFDRIYSGIDWGWYPDPFHWGKMHFDSSRRRLYIYDEFRCNKQSNLATWEYLRDKKGILSNDLIIADSAENKSIADYKSYGAYIRGAQKGPGSVDYSMKWLQSLFQIIIDPKRAPYTAKEFLNYEYETNKDGETISGYPDKDNHAIDMCRYAMSQVWRKKGK